MVDKFPRDVRKRTWVALDVSKHVPADIVLRSMEPGTEYSMLNLKDKLSEIANENLSTGSYVKFLVDAGLVQYRKDMATNDAVKGFCQLTQSGYIHGRRIAEFTIAYVADNDYSLTGIFGQRVCFEKSSYRRFKLLEELVLLACKGPMRKTHLSRDVKSDRSSISRDLVILSQQGLVDCAVEDVKEVVVKKSRFSGTKEGIKNLEGFTRGVAYSLRKGNLSIQKIQNDTGYMSLTIIGALHELSEKGLTQVVDSFLNTRKCTVIATERGREFWHGFLVPLEGIVSPESEINPRLSDKEFYAKAQQAMQKYLAWI